MPEESDARTACGYFRVRSEPLDWRGGWPAGWQQSSPWILAVHGVLTVADWSRLAYEARGLRGDMDAAFRKAFPEAKAVVDPALQMRRNIADLRRAAGEADAADFVPMLVKLSPVLATFSGSPQSLKFERGEMELQLPVSPEETRERLASRMRIPGLRVRIEGITTGGAVPLATIRVAPDGG
jgi:general secretion pathway protein L